MTDVRRDITQPSGWVGIAVFGGLMLMLAGWFQAIAGIVGIVNNSYWEVRSNDLLVDLGYTVWGWAHLALGVFAFAVGAGIALGRAWARVAGIVLAGMSSIMNLAFLAADPAWSTLIIVFDVLVIYALTVHGKEIQT